MIETILPGLWFETEKRSIHCDPVKLLAALGVPYSPLAAREVIADVIAMSEKWAGKKLPVRNVHVQDN